MFDPLRSLSALSGLPLLPEQESLPPGKSFVMALNELRPAKPSAPRWHAEVDALTAAQHQQDAENAQGMRQTLRAKRLELERSNEPAHTNKAQRVAELETQLMNEGNR